MNDVEPQALRLGLLIQLEHRARRAGRTELPFVMVNETAQILPYQQAALWLRSGGGDDGRLAALSGVATPELNGPYARWLRRILDQAALLPPWDEPRPLTSADLQAEMAADWAEWLPPHAVWCPLPRIGGSPLGGLLFARANPWTEGERQVLGLLADHYAQCWMLTHLAETAPPWLEGWKRRRRMIAAAAIGLCLLALFPVRQSALVPAEVVPIDPLQIRAPFDGIIDAIPVEPNAEVRAGAIVVALETRQLRTRLRVAQKAREIAEAEFGQASQQAMTDDKAKGKLALLRAKVEQQTAELAYAEDLLARSALTSPADGIAIFDSPADWIGRPVSVGERIMLVADPAKVELELQVPVAEAVTFETGAAVGFFRNVAPERPLDARLVFASYSSAVTPEGVAAYRFRARLDGGETPRIGLKGTAKLYGQRRPLVIWLLRRPLAVMRQWLGL